MKALTQILPEYLIAPATAGESSSDGKPSQFRLCLERVMSMPESVSGEHGHDAIYAVACEIKRWAIPSPDDFEIISEFNAKRCHPPWGAADLKRKLREGHKRTYKEGEIGKRLAEQGNIDKDVDANFAVVDPQTAPPAPKKKSSRKKGGKKSQATAIVDSVRDLELFRSEGGKEYFACVTVGEHREVHKIRSNKFKQYLIRLFAQSEGKTPSASALQDAIAGIEAIALDAKVEKVWLRTAEHEEKIYLDMGDDRWRAIEIDTEGWRIIEKPPVMFRRSDSTLAFPEPIMGGSIDDLRQFVNIPNAEWPLVKGWLAMALNPRGPYAVLNIAGEPGSAKTTTGRMLRKLCDPHEALDKRGFKSDRDLAIHANGNWAIVIDNLSHLSDDLSDAICCVSTGSSFSTRTLYSDDGETTFCFMRPVILNGIENVASRSDLLDRCVFVDLEPLRRPKKVEIINAEFNAAAPGIFGGLLTAVSEALRNQNAVQIDKLPRMADFAVWATAAEPALGLQPGEFMAAYEVNRATRNQLALEASIIYAPLTRLLADCNNEWSDTPSELLSELEKYKDGSFFDMRLWPKTPKVLSGELRRIAKCLETANIFVAFSNTSKGRSITIYKKEEPTNEPASN